MFDTLSSRLDTVFKSLRGRGRLSDADIDATAREIRIALLEADVALPVVRSFVAAIKERARGIAVSQALNPAQQVIKIVNEELIGILGGDTKTLRLAKTPPTVILLAGLQGTGKTTLAGKLGVWLKKQGHSPLLVAADLQRPNAVNQLQVVGSRAGVEVFAPEPGNGVGDPVAVARDAIAHARRHVFDVVVVDTAGRLGVDEEMMRQAADIRDAVSPDEILFVLDAMVGQDAVNTATAFLDGVGFSGVVLTKLDGDARGGAALSVAHITGRPIMFASTGEALADFDVFHPERMASRILGMGDVLTLIEQAEQAFDQEEAEQMARKMAASEFTLEDFLNQMLAVRRLGPIGNLLGMLPGMGQMKDQIAQIDDRDVDRVVAIIRSMTPGERHDPGILQKSRKERIARGSGVTVTEVNQLLDRFGEARKMMRQLAGGAGLPGMMGRGKAAQARKAPKKGKGASKKGNPAARAAQAEQAKNKQAGRVGGQLGPGLDGPGGMPPGGLGDVDLSALLKPGAFNQPGRRGR
ncbi:signal recognition particle protein [Frankia sp. CNm7]|uniref:Signal recognition particle protein n=1 Tax=Frankia nepalensis TaxID=1836974 RepID=A0A937RML8_9ACTN|nr:signal recognition particle protein [Frankia nepalensis]MBL7497024.1 signal recognition particle protein [Frankia nepalensis]MBL7510508.1 signal recognition particle protein [Frankia nepalensis]MBL7517084.1 signal recognition particle protein [Frankia nepalensis]MBL7628661.1 signal recognition particle protein [Frankia nepalensis]